MNLQFYIESDISANGYGLYIFNRETREVVKPLETEVIKKDVQIPRAAVITSTQAQHLMDSLWDVGIRPNEGSGSAGSLKATENHLQDMRKIVFHEMGMK